jgi:imidazoleglycerol-phosphate dehydratase
VEACFKGFGRALGDAVAINRLAPDEIPSTKGTIN